MNIKKNYIGFTCITYFAFVLFSHAYAKEVYTDIVKNAQLAEVAHALQPEKSQEQAAYLLLAKLGCLAVDDTSTNEKKLIEDCTALKSFSVSAVSVPDALRDLFNQLLKQGVMQGYNIKKQADVTTLASGKNSLVYGHSSLVHAKQLIALLTANNIDFTSQLIAKSSAFNIRDGWDDAQPGQDNVKIRVAQEYDIRFSFADEKTLTKFMPLINQYAKKDDNSESGLIIDAWWQPFYRTLSAREDYHQVQRISVTYEGYVASSLVLNTDLEKTLKQINAHIDNEKFVVFSESIWVNPAFFRYLNGDYQ
ncbi:hypothetical protein J8L70_06665 [Pseudoalteromonas sp. MMG010]|uniref:hypothetical protein n=1 Tax=Pseudoalteromonas sp. MMG010 TaxID=2822685 RepID=UPI001B39F18E|nr:hypothetical protein [Pseudoalteromonas sp. MMG010]MBQ4832918.1 hypothetical protein [Pseudoalteromonas sp. MMG010]